MGRPGLNSIWVLMFRLGFDQVIADLLFSQLRSFTWNIFKSNAYKSGEEVPYVLGNIGGDHIKVKNACPNRELILCIGFNSPCRKGVLLVLGLTHFQKKPTSQFLCDLSCVLKCKVKRKISLLAQIRSACHVWSKNNQFTHSILHLLCCHRETFVFLM